MQMILAADANWGIGKDNGLLARLPGDMKYFRRTTKGKTVVMGRKTFQSLPGGALPYRENIVLSRSEFSAPDITVVHSVEELLELLKGKESEQVFIMGGGEIYRLLLPYTDRIYLTRILAGFPADTHFVDLDALPEWECVSQSEKLCENEIEYCFCVYERKV